MQSQRLLNPVAPLGYFRRRWKFWAASFGIASVAVPALVYLTVRGVPERILLVTFYVIGDSAYLINKFRRTLLRPVFLAAALASSIPVPWLYITEGTSWKVSWFFGVAAAAQLAFLFAVQLGIERFDAVRSKPPEGGGPPRRK